MESYWPSLTAAVIAAFIIFYLFPQFTPVILAFFAGAALVYGVYNHYRMFGAEYSMMTWVDAARASAPTVMVGTVIAFTIGYLLFMARSGRSANIPSPSYAPASTATNPATNAISRAINYSSNNSSNSRLPYNERVA